MKKVLTTFFLIAAIALETIAQIPAPNPDFRHITENDGLSSNQVRAIIQDRFGYVWMGTDNGLDRYDGNEFRNYSFENKGQGYTVLSLYEDGPIIWVGTDKGLFFFTYSDENIEPFIISTKEGVQISSDIMSIVMDKDDNLWIATLYQGIFRYSQKSNALDQFQFPDSNDQMSNVYVDSANQVWALTNWGGPVLYRLNKATDGFEPFIIKAGSNIDRGGLAFFEDSEKRFWLGTWDAGLYEIDRITGEMKLHLSPSEQARGLNHIHSIMEYAPGKLVISSDDGVMSYDVKTGLTNLYETDLSDDFSISGRFVYPLMVDREGGLWAGTYYGGVNYLSPFHGRFTRYPRKNDMMNGKVISRFCEDPFHNIWIASDDGGLYKYNRHTGEFNRYMPGYNIHALCMDGYDLWIGTYDGGVNVMDVRTDRIRTYEPVEGDDSSIDGTSSYSIFKDKESRIWVTTMTGIHIYDREKDCFKRIRRIGTTIIDIDQDAEGNMWFSTSGRGLIKYDAGTQSWKQYRYSEERNDSILHDYVNCGLLDSNGRMLFGTEGGMCYYNQEKDTFEPFDFGQESYLSNIKGIIEDHQTFWITTAHGLMRYDQSDGLQVFTTGDGLQSNQFIPNSIMKASDGRIYIGTANGFNAFDPYQIRTNNVVPSLSITSPDTQTADGEPSIELSYKDKGLTIRFASLSFCAPGKNQYAYILVGFDDDWHYVGNQDWATYTNLPSGSYTFMVKGSNNDGLWNEEPTCVNVTVRPHLLLSTPFMIIYVFLFILLILSAIIFVIKRNERKYTVKIDEINARKEREIFESKIEFFTMIAHEIRTPVSLIIGPLEKVMKKTDILPEPVAGDLEIINHNSQRLLYLVNQLLDFRKVEQDGMKMRFMSQPIAPLMREICKRFEPTITYNGASLIVECPPEDFSACVDSEAMTKLISNLLTNAGKYTKDLVKLSCCVHPTDPDMFNIMVYDNGCGISQEEQAKIFRPFYQTSDNKPGTGIGLSLVKSITELHGGIISVKSEPGRFTMFTVTLPIYHESGSVVPEHTASVKNEPAEPSSIEDILTSDLVEIQPEYKPCVLIVDDNEEMISFLTSTFSDSYQLLSALDGEEALEVLSSHPDVVLIVADWMMPRMDGIELCRHVRENTDTSHIPFILLTAKTDDVSKVAGMDCGADAYIEKPFSVQYLEACMKNLVGLRAMLRQKYASSPLAPLTTVASSNVDSKFLQEMTDLIEAHFSDSNLSVDFLTEHMGISRSSLYNKIKSLTDKTPNELIQLMRLKKAAQLLMEKKYRINEICYMVGFNNPSYFSKCFSKQFGMKPGEFASRSGE